MQHRVADDESRTRTPSLLTRAHRSAPALHEGLAETDDARDDPHDDRADDEGEEHGCDHQHRHRRSERPVLRAAELGGDHRPDHVALGAAEDGGGDVVTTHRDEGEEHAGDDAGASERERDAEERRHPTRTQVLARLAHPRVDAIEGDEERQDHEAEVVVDDRDLHRE